MADEQQHEVISPNEVLSKLSGALISLSRSDPLVSLSNEIDLRFQWVRTQLTAMERATDLQHQDMVRVPTLLQTATTSLREVLHQELETITARLQGEIDKIYSEISQKFISVANQFEERDTRTDQRAGDTKLAVDAAFAAAKEATAKIEAGFKEQIKALTDLVDTKTAQLSRETTDVKDRVIAIENRTGGQANGASWIGSLVIGGAIVFATLISLAGFMLTAFRHV